MLRLIVTSILVITPEAFEIKVFRERSPNAFAAVNAIRGQRRKLRHALFGGLRSASAISL